MNVEFVSIFLLRFTMFDYLLKLVDSAELLNGLMDDLLSGLMKEYIN